MNFNKIISWNVNGIRAWYKKNAFEFIIKESPDIFCIQETKAEENQLSVEIKTLNNHFPFYFFNSSIERKGHSGTAILSKIKPDKVTFGLGKKELDGQGRQINFFFGETVLINCYFPNGGGNENKLLYKLNYFENFVSFIKKLRKQGYSVIFCGDVNIAHEEIDLARPENNKNEVGFLPEERLAIDEIINENFIDIFRNKNPKEIKYTWWDMKTFSRQRNVGWRLDYFFTDKEFFNKNKKIDCKIFDEIQGSDHCPVLLRTK
jgi:exodeoxyribonuclease III